MKETLQSLLLSGQEELKEKGVPEPDLDAKYLLLEAFCTDMAHFLMDRGRGLAETEENHRMAGRYWEMIRERARRVPLQQILGTQEFMGLSFFVSPHVLIPRQDTETLAETVLKEHPGAGERVLELCTGSGCIAVALASVLPFSKVTATDISEKALNVARENAGLWKVKVNFVLSDALAQSNPAKRTYNIIVSNPPYICSSEAREMDKNVLHHEPHLALFVPDNDPLKFYRPITENASRMLVPGGYLYFEINPAYSNQIAGLLNRSGFSDVNTITDIHGKKRFITALWPDE